MFAFERFAQRDFTETIKILSGLSLFVIVAITNPKSSALKLQATVPDYMVPFVPILLKGEKFFSMFADLKRYPWVLNIRSYSSKDRLIASLENDIFRPAIAMHDELIAKRAEKLRIGDG